MLPALLVFALVALFATYVAVAYIVRDPLWLQTLAEHQPNRAGTTGAQAVVRGAARW